jgi:hypothetical protein
MSTYLESFQRVHFKIIKAEFGVGKLAIQIQRRQSAGRLQVLLEATHGGADDVHDDDG